MNRALLALNIILLTAVGVLFFLFFSRNDNVAVGVDPKPVTDTAARWQHTPVAYFDMDSVEANFSLFKQMQAEVVKREARINDSINQMKQAFHSYYMRLQSQGANLSPRQRDSLGNELAQMDMDIKNKANVLNQDYQTYYMNKQQEIVR